MDPDDVEAVLDEADRVITVQLQLVQFEILLRATLPDVLDVALAGLARAVKAEIIGLHNRVSMLERQLNRG